MNQILDYNPGGPSRNSGSGENTKLIFKIFGVMILIIAVILIAKGMIDLFSSHENSSSKKNNNTIIDDSNKTKAIVNVEQRDNTAVISVTHDKEIKRVVYQWDTNTPNTKSGDNSNQFEKTIDIPSGTHTLYITVIDKDNVETLYEKEFTVEDGVDIEIPSINIFDLGGGKLKITATDNMAMDYITYRWNEDEEQRVQATEENQEKLEVVIDALKGTNKLTIAAVDKSNKTSSITKTIVGQNKPVIKVSASEDVSKLIIKAEHEKGIKRIDYTLYNGEPTDTNTKAENYSISDQNGTSVEFSQTLNIGYNRIIIRVTSQDDVIEEYDGEIVRPATTENPNNSYNYNNTNTTTNTTTNTQTSSYNNTIVNTTPAF